MIAHNQYGRTKTFMNVDSYPQKSRKLMFLLLLNSITQMVLHYRTGKQHFWDIMGFQCCEKYGIVACFACLLLSVKNNTNLRILFMFRTRGVLCVWISGRFIAFFLVATRIIWMTPFTAHYHWLNIPYLTILAWSFLISAWSSGFRAIRHGGTTELKLQSTSVTQYERHESRLRDEIQGFSSQLGEISAWGLSLGTPGDWIHNSYTCFR